MDIKINNKIIKLDLELFNNEINQEMLLYKTYRFIQENKTNEEIIFDDLDFFEY